MDRVRASGTDRVRASLFAGTGPMRERCRAHDWASSPLGAAAAWPQSLRTAASVVLGAAVPMVLLWGDELVQLYNDGYVPLLAAKHPGGLGQPTQECWPEVWHLNAPIYARVRAGETVAFEDACYPVRRQGPDGPVEDLYVTISYSPVADEGGAVAGVLVTVVDTTAQVVGRAAQAERGRLEAGLRDAQQQVARLLDQVSDAYALLDGDFRIVDMNPSAERALARSRADLIGRTHGEAFPASVDSEPARQVRRVSARQVEAHFAHHYVGDGYDFHLEIDAYPAEDGGVAIFWRDVSERVRAAEAVEAARADAEARAATLAAVIDSIPDAVLVRGTEGITLANQAALDQLGVPSIEALRAAVDAEAAVLESVLLDPVTGTVVPLADSPIGRALQGERSHAQFLLRALGASDAAREPAVPALRPVRASAAPIVGPDGAVIGAVAVLTDMSRLQAASRERERLLAELDGERSLLRTVLDQMPAAVFIVEAPSGRVLALNAEVARVWGEPRPLTDDVGHYSEEWVGYHLDGRRIASEEWPVARAVLGSETVTDWVGEIERADGTRVTIEVNAVPVRDAHGRTVAAVAVAADITARAVAARERELLLRELEVERSRLAYLFEQAPTFLAVLRGATYEFALVNPAFARMVGRRELVGRTVMEVFPDMEAQGFIGLMNDALATGTPFVGHEVPITLPHTPDAAPEQRFVDFVYMPIIEADGTRSGVIAHGSDVTEQVRTRRQIERLLAESEQARQDAEASRAEAQAANRTKGDFLAVMSHELRTPLNAIGGYVELIELGIRGPVTPQQREDLARIQRSQRHLLGLINGVLNYSRAEAGAVHYELREVALDPVLATCEMLVATQARAKAITLRVMACDEPLAVRADAEKLQQILVNLLSNAVKFTASGGEVTLACARDPRAEGEDAVVVSVADTGRGIAATELERVFEPFVQVDTRLTRSEEGMGLGLAISRDLARGMRGDITVDSTPGVGSTFRLVLPAA